MKDNISNSVIASFHLPTFRYNKKVISSYKRSSNLTKIFTFSGIFLILYFIYVNLKPSGSDLKDPENIKENTIISTKNNANYKVKILNSTFKGVNANLNHYQVNIAQAVRIFENNYLLKKIDAKYTINPHEQLLVNAASGILNESTQILELQNNVEFVLGETILKTHTAQINFLSKEANSNTRILLLFKNSKLQADHFSSIDNNVIIKFKGQVSTVIDMADFGK